MLQFGISPYGVEVLLRAKERSRRRRTARRNHTPSLGARPRPESNPGGLAARHAVLIVRENVGCDPGFFFTWQDAEVGPLWSRTPVGSTIHVWIVDVGETLLVIEAETSRQADSDLKREVQRIVGSIRFRALFES